MSHFVPLFQAKYIIPTVFDVLRTVGGLALATGASLFLRHLNPEDYFTIIALLYLLNTLVVSFFSRSWVAGLVSAVAGLLFVNYLFLNPHDTFRHTLGTSPFLVVCIVFLFVMTSVFTVLLKSYFRMRSHHLQEKMSNRMLRSLSHDLRTPLTSITIASSALLESRSLLSVEEQDVMLTGIRQESEWFLCMMENILSLTRRIDARGQPQIDKIPSVAEDVVTEAVGQFHRRFPDRTVHVSLPPLPRPVPMDDILIKQVLQNLLNNIIYHTSPSTEAFVSLRYEGAFAFLSVADNGQGVCDAVLTHLFDSTDDGKNRDSERHLRHTNMGIGLYACRQIVEAHGGTIVARHRDNGGLCITFSLPFPEGAEYV